MTSQSTQTYWYDVLVPITICLGAFLRFYHFWVPPIWVDEYGTWWVVAADTWSEVIERTLKIQGQSPFYYMLVRGVTEIAGYGSFQLRLVSVIFGTAALTPIYPLAAKIFDDRRVALLSLLIVALSESFIWYSQIARPYALALFFSLISFWSFVSFHKAGSKAHLTAYVLSTALTVYAHYLFGLIVIIQVVYLVLGVGYRRLFSKLWLTTFATLALLLVPAMKHVLFLHYRRHALDWVSSLDSSWKIASGIIYIIGGASPMAILLAMGVLALTGFNWADLTNARIRNTLVLPVIWYTVPFIMFLMVPISLGVNLVQTRYLLFAYPATCFLLAWLMLNVRVSGFRSWLSPAVFVIATIIFVSIPALSSTKTFARWPNRAWNDALAKLSQLYRSDGLVVAQVGLVEADLLANDSYDPTFLSYLTWPLVSSVPGLKPENMAILPYRLTEHTDAYLRLLVDRAAKHSRIWLVGSGEPVSLFRDQLFHLNYRMSTQYDHDETIHLSLLERDRRFQ
jgi:uncharacterized membrane protein